jgi:hypothetical protein
MSIRKIKIGIFLLALCLILRAGAAFAYFDDTEANSTSFSAGILDFYLETDGDFSPPKASYGNPVNKEISVKNNGTLGFNYNIKADNFSGDSYLCENLNLEVSLNSDPSIIYTGPLKDFDIFAGEYSDPAKWNFAISIAIDDPLFYTGQVCHFDFIFDGKQIGDIGFSDQEVISNTVIDGDAPEIKENRQGSEHYIIVDGLFIDPNGGEQLVEGESETVEPVIEEPLVVVQEPVTVPAVNEEPVIVEEPIVVEEPIIVEEPIVVQEPEKTQELVLNENQDVPEIKENILP